MLSISDNGPIRISTRRSDIPYFVCGRCILGVEGLNRYLYKGSVPSKLKRICKQDRLNVSSRTGLSEVMTSRKLLLLCKMWVRKTRREKRSTSILL